MRTILRWTGVLLVVCFLWVAVGYSYLFKGVYATYLHGKTTSNIHDRTHFEQALLPASSQPQPWPEALQPNDWKPSADVQAALDSLETGALLIAWKDTLRYESYTSDVTPTSLTNSFSMGKSVVTLLTQMAIERGDIPSWDTKVKEYLPWIHGPGAKDLTLRHLSTMTATLDWDESYTNPLGVMARVYYNHSVEETMKTVEVGANPGVTYVYQSGATQLLGFCLESATGQTLPQLAGRDLWDPLGAEQDATWHMDGEGEALAYCCLNATARDFARLGKLILHQGSVNKKEIVDKEFIEMATQPFKAEEYGHSFWLGKTSNGTPFSYFRGHLGQWIVTIPSLQLVAVRVGHFHGPSRGAHPRALMKWLDQLVALP